VRQQHIQDQEPPDDQPAGGINRALKIRRRALPWSDRTILVVSLLVVLILIPLWLDPQTLTRVAGGNPSPSPSPTVPGTAAPPIPAPTEAPLSSAAIVATDTFARSVAPGWGAADVGGNYTVSGSGTLSVAGGQATVTLAPNSSGQALLESVDARDVIVQHSVASDQIAVGELNDLTLLRASDTAAYAVVVRISADDVQVGLQRNVGEETDQIGRFVSVPVSGVTNGRLRIHAEASGAEPTSIKVRVWPADQSEPNTWQINLVDWTGVLQHPGAIGLGWTSTNGASGALLISDLTAWVTGETAQ
jgi:hypothetical protein